MVNRVWIYTAFYVGSLFLASLYFKHDEKLAVDKAVTANTATLVAQYNKKLEEADLKFKKQTADMQTSADNQKKEKDEKIATLNVSLNTAISELRNRPSRPAPSTTPSTESAVRGASCDATQLYYEDAEFLTREAARAESVLIERNYYYSRYITVQDQMNRANQ